MADEPQGTLPATPPEMSERELAERKAAQDRARSERKGQARQAWSLVPPAFRASGPDLMTRCSGLIRARLGKLGTPTLSALLLGPTGVGKTSAVAWLLGRSLAEFEQSDGERFAQAPGLLWATATDVALSDRRHPLGAEQPPLVKLAISATALVLDDVGLEPAGVLWEVLQARYYQRRPTLATTGLTKRQLSDHLGAAGVRRLTDQHAGYPVLVVDAHEPKSQGGGKT